MQSLRKEVKATPADKSTLDEVCSEFSALRVDSFVTLFRENRLTHGFFSQRDRGGIFDWAEPTDESINQNLPGISGTLNVRAAVEAQLEKPLSEA